MKKTTRLSVYWCITLVVAALCFAESPSSNNTSVSTSTHDPKSGTAGLTSEQQQLLQTAYATFRKRPQTLAKASKRADAAGVVSHSVSHSGNAKVSIAASVPSGAYLKNLANELDQEVERNEAQRRRHKHMSRIYGQEPQYTRTGHDGAVHNHQHQHPRNHHAAPVDHYAGYGDSHDGTYTKHDGAAYRKYHTGDSQHHIHAGLVSQDQHIAAASSDPTLASPDQQQQQALSQSRYIPSGSFMCMEASRSGCAAAEGVLNALTQGGMVYTSKLVSCTRQPVDQAAGAVISTADAGATRTSRLHPQHASISACTWTVNYLPKPKKVAPGITRIGFGIATCRVNDLTEVCDGSPCEGLAFKAEISAYKTYAMTDKPHAARTYGSSCTISHGGSNQPQEGAPSHYSVSTAATAALHPKTNNLNKGRVTIAGQPGTGAALDAPVNQPPTTMYGGEAIILTGPISPGGQVSGVIEYVASFEGHQLTAPEASSLPEHTPLVRPNSLRFMLVVDRDEN